MVAAVVREFREETGLVAVCGPMIGWVEQMSAEHHFVIVDFEAVSYTHLTLPTIYSV